MAFKPIFDVPTEALTKKRVSRNDAKPKRVARKDQPRGCKPCPMNKVQGVTKIISPIKGREILVVSQSPGHQENKRGLDLYGSSGQFIWKHLRRIGITRKDCDIFSVMRCMPATWVDEDSYLQMRKPAQEELRCCSLHTDLAFEKVKAKQILVLGAVAAKALLQTRSLPGQKIFWSDKLKAKVYLVDHPSFFSRGYGKGPRFDNFKKIIEQFGKDRQKSGKVLSDQFAYVRKQNYRLVTTEQQAIAARKILKKYAANGRRICFDIEYYPHPKIEGQRVLQCCGFSPKPGSAFVFVFRHKDVPKEDGRAVRAIARSILEDVSIQKTGHHGVSDIYALRELSGIDVKGYTHDTNLSEFLRFSDKKKYGLDELMETRFPEFAGYSLIVVDDMLKGVDLPPAIAAGTLDVKYKYVDKNKLFNTSKLSLDNLRIYNGADCDLGKRLEISNKKHVPQALMQLYIDLSFLLWEMEPNGPFFDYEQHAKLNLLYPWLEKNLRARLKELAGSEDFNPGSPQQVVDVLYGSKKSGGLGLYYPFDGKPNSTKMTLLVLGRKHEFPRLMIEWRSVSKVKSTYLDGYERCAQLNNDRLRTKWWSTGARTGRLSSGGGKDKKKHPNVINLQNIKKDPHMQNMCVADIRWKRAYRGVGSILRRYPVILKYWQECQQEEKQAKKYKRKSKKIAKSLAVQAAIKTAAHKIERWLARHIPDLKTFVILDYGQVEVRVAAQMSGDKNLIKDCADSDIHTRVGVAMTHWDPDRIANDNATRTLTKNVHFGILFGISKKNLYKFVLAMSPPDMRDRISEEQVGEAYDNYFARYPGIRRFIEAQRDFAFENHFVTTMFGMIQTLNVTDDAHGEDDDIESMAGDELDGRKSYWGNQAINGPVQGSAHQLMICALVNLIRKRLKYKVLGVPTNEVHDALYFFANVLDLREAVSKSKYLLEKESLNTVKTDFPNIKWKVPIAVDTEAGLRLGCKVDVDENTSPGMFILEWYHKCRKQIIELNRELEKVAA